MKRVIFSFVVLSVIYVNHIFGQTLIKEKFDNSNFSFVYSFKNDTKEEIHIDSIGGVIQVNKGTFDCKGNQGLKEPLSDYTFHFEPKNATVYIPEYPDISILPGETKEFSLTFVPNVKRACSDWAFEIKVMINFSNGAPYYSTPKLLIKDNYYTNTNKIIPESEIQANIYSADEQNRIDAMNSLEYSSISDELKERFIKFVFENSSDKVKIPAVMAIYNNHLNNMAGYLNSLIYSPLPTNKKKTIIYALGKIDNQMTGNSLIGQMLNGDEKLVDACVKSLVSLGKGDIKAKVEFMLKKHLKWVAADIQHTNRLLAMIKVLVQYNDKKAIADIVSILEGEATTEFKRNILTYLDGYYKSGNSTQQAYLAGLSNTFKNLLFHKDPDIQLHALNLYMATSDDTKSQKKVIKKLLKHKDLAIRYQAAIWVSKKGFNESATDALKACANIEENESNFDIFQSLKEMKDKNQN
jgi:hypothetical protein